MNVTQAIQSLNKIELSESEKTWLIRLHEHVTETTCNKDSRPYLTGIGSDAKIAVLVRSECKMWNCPHCAAKNARRWIARIINHINKTDDAWQMFTLTAHRNARTEYKSVLNLRQGWKKLYNRMRYEFGVSDYVKVWERHADDVMHLHGLVNNQSVNQRWLKDNATGCGMGYQVDMHAVDNAGQVAGYIAKYFMKSELVDASPFPKSLRRIEVSRSWTKLPDLTADNKFSWLINSTREGQLRTAGNYHTIGYDIMDYVKE